MIRTILEDVGDNLFNPDPCYQQGGDMVRVGGLSYRCEPGAKMGQRIQDMRLNDKPVEAGKTTRWPVGRRCRKPARMPDRPSGRLWRLT